MVRPPLEYLSKLRINEFSELMNMKKNRQQNPKKMRLLLGEMRLLLSVDCNRPTRVVTTQM